MVTIRRRRGGGSDAVGADAVGADAVGDVPAPLTAATLDEGLQSASVLVAGASMMFAKWARGFQAHTNQLPLFDQQLSNKSGGDPNIRSVPEPAAAAHVV